MLDIIWQCFMVSVAGGFLSLDRTAALQVMVSRPIVAAPAIGYILGDVLTGLMIGGILELLWIGELPIGGHIPAHEVMLTVSIAAISIIAQKMLGQDFLVLHVLGSDIDASILFILGLIILLLTPMDMICKKVDTTARNFNMRFFNAALSDLDKGFIGSVEVNNIKGLGVFFILNFSTIFALVFAGVLLTYFLLPLLPKMVVMSLPLVFGAACVLSISSAYSAVYSNKSLPVFLATTFITVAATLVIFR